MAYIDQKPKDENGKPHGEYINHYGNGQLCFRWNYVHGVPHGLSEYYHDNGTLWYRGYWNMDKKIGYWYWHDLKKYYYLWLI